MKNVISISIVLFFTISLLFGNSQFSYIIQVAYLEKDFQNVLNDDKLKKIGKLILQDGEKDQNNDGKPGKHVYLVASNSKFFNKWEADKKLKEIKALNNKDYENAFIINIQDKLPLKEYVDLKNTPDLDFLTLIIDLNKQPVSVPEEELIPRGANNIVSNRQTAKAPVGNGHFTLQVGAFKNRIRPDKLTPLQVKLKLQEKRQILKPFPFKLSDGTTNYRYFYNNYGNDFQLAKKELDKIKHESGCSWKKELECPRIVFIDRSIKDKQLGNFQSICQDGTRVLKYYSIQLQSGSLSRFNNEEAFKQDFFRQNNGLKTTLNKKPLFVTSTDQGDILHTGKFLRFKDALREKARIGHGFIIELEAELFD